MRADLHLHTNASDGLMSSAEVISAAAEVGMRIVSVTDHDTVVGVAQAQDAGKRLGLMVIPGIELTTGGVEEVHLLGYGLNAADVRLHMFLESQQAERRERMRQMLEKLGKLGMDIPPEDVGEGRFMGRMNLARALVAHGHVASVREAFERYLNVDCPAYVPRRHIAVPEGVAILKSFGAVVSLAHPGRLKMDRQTLTARLPGWIEAGLLGIEAYHASHSQADALWLDRMARRQGLLVTGGSDCHGRGPESAQIGGHLPLWRSVEADVTALLEQLSKP